MKEVSMLSTPFYLLSFNLIVKIIKCNLLLVHTPVCSFQTFQQKFLFNCYSIIPLLFFLWE